MIPQLCVSLPQIYFIVEKSQQILPCPVSLGNHYFCYRVIISEENIWSSEFWQTHKSILGFGDSCSLSLFAYKFHCRSDVMCLPGHFWYQSLCLGMGLSTMKYGEITFNNWHFFGVLSIESHIRKLNSYISASLLTVQRGNEWFLHFCIVYIACAQRKVSNTF